MYMNQNTNKFKQTNAFAMQYGVVLGIIGILSLCAMGLSFHISIFSFFSTLLTVGSPIVAALLTLRFRKAVMVETEGFSFGRGFLFTFMMGAYASIWVALFVFVYLAYIDNGAFFDAYEAMLTQPELVAEMRRSGVMEQLAAAGTNLTDIVATMRGISPAQYAGMVIYLSILAAPVISAIIALIARRSPIVFFTNSEQQKTSVNESQS